MSLYMGTECQCFVTELLRPQILTAEKLETVTDHLPVRPQILIAEKLEITAIIDNNNNVIEERFKISKTLPVTVVLYGNTLKRREIVA